MARYIDLDKFRKWQTVDFDFCNGKDCEGLEFRCEDCFYNDGGAEDVAPVIHAVWELLPQDFTRCSNCHILNSPSLYCPSCGAKMDRIIRRLDIIDDEEGIWIQKKR